MPLPASFLRPAAPWTAPGLLGAVARALAGLRRWRVRRQAQPAFHHLSLAPGQACTLARPTGGLQSPGGPAGRWGSTRGEGLQVEILSGRIWLTRSGQAADHMLVGGQRLHVAGPGRVVVQAMGRETAWLRIGPGR